MGKRGVTPWRKKTAKQYLTPSPKEVCTIALENENIEKICECFMKGFCCSETSNIKDIFTMWSTEGANIANKRPSEIPCFWNTTTYLSKMEQNCENLHLKDKYFAKDVLVEQSHQNTCRECKRNFFSLGKNASLYWLPPTQSFAPT